MKKDTIAVKEEALAVAKEACLGNNTCSNNCSGCGKCVNYGFACAFGFTGADCSVALASMLIIGLTEVMPMFHCSNLPF